MTQLTMPCPRQCGVDVRAHHSTDKVNGGCDTGPMSAEDMREWFEMRGAGTPGCMSVEELIAQYYGKSEVELDDLHSEMCGPTA